MSFKTESPLSLINKGSEVLEEFWNNRLSEMRKQVSEFEISEGYVDPTLKSLVDLMELAISVRQYEGFVGNMFTPVTKVIRVNIKSTTRYVVERETGVKMISVYGVGLYTTMEGLMLSESFRDQSNFDKFGKKGVVYNLSDIPDGYLDDYEFRLSIPALNGLFVPKKSLLTQCIDRAWQIQFFDISI